MSSDKQDTAEDPDEIRAEIEKTREELGDTVAALSHKVDVKGRVSEGFEERKEHVKETVSHARETISHAGARAQEQAAEAAAAARERAASVRESAQHARQTPQEDRRPAIVGGVLAVVFVLLLVRWRRSR